VIALILAGGEVHAKGRWLARLPEANLVIAADGGLRHARTLGVTPNLLVGDLDSVTQAERDAWPNLPTQIHPTDKDALDLELALDAARERGATEVWIAGAFGGRLDQTLAAATIAEAYNVKGLRIALLDGLSEVYPLATGQSWRVDLPRGTTFSLLALSERARLDVRGAKYTLSNEELRRGSGVGVSNESQGSVHVDVHEGSVLLVVVWTD